MLTGIRAPLARYATPICAAVGFCCYLPALGAGRLADDFVLLRTVHRLNGISWAFTHNDLGQAGSAGHFYRPVWVLWNAALNAVSSHPWLAHVMNLVLFAVICAEVSILLRVLLPAPEAVLGGLLFAVLPYHGESVAWISGNTDLLAGAIGLPALILTAGCRGRPRDLLLIGGLTVLAGMAKEIALVLPFIAALLLWARAGEDPPRTAQFRAVLAMFAAAAFVAALRWLVISGVGGYSSPFTAKRGIGSLISFSIGALSVPQLAVLAHPVLLLVPAGLLALMLWGVQATRRSHSTHRFRVAILGIGWFLLSIGPVLNQPLNLNTRNGDRLLLLPSVGLAVLVASLLAVRSRLRCLAIGVGIGAGATLSLLNAADWQTAGTESTRLLGDLRRIAPANARLVALSVPTDFRAAHLYPDGLDVALQQTGRPDVELAMCMPVHALGLRGGELVTQPRPGGRWSIRTTPAAPFDVPVLGTAVSTTGGCSISRTSGSAAGLGTALDAEITIAGSAPQAVYFDGLDMRRAPGG